MARRYEARSLCPLGGHKVHKMVKFRPRGVVDKREMEQAQLFETADERGCTPMFGAAHRRGSASIGGFLPPPGGGVVGFVFFGGVECCPPIFFFFLIFLPPPPPHPPPP